MWVWGGGGCVNLGVGVMWEGGSGYGACEDRGVEMKGVFKRLVPSPLFCHMPQ